MTKRAQPDPRTLPDRKDLEMLWYTIRDLPVGKKKEMFVNLMHTAWFDGYDQGYDQGFKVGEEGW